MKKFSDLKKWVTISEAAKRLSNYFGEDITEADVLQQALDGHLKISVNIVTPVKARRTVVVKWCETEWLMLQSARKNPLPPELTPGNAECPPILQILWDSIPEDDRENFSPALCGRKIDDARYIVVEQHICEINGIYDLPMVGAERTDVEHQYHLMTCGPVVGVQNTDDAFVEDENGIIWQLQDRQRFGAPPTEADIQLRELKEYIRTHKIKRPVMQKLLREHEHQYQAEYSQERDRELDKIFPCNDDTVEYEPAYALPEESVLVLRSTTLREFERLMSEAPSVNERCRTVDKSPKVSGHLNFDPDIQLKANEIAEDLESKSVMKKAPTKGQVARILGPMLGMEPATVLRRFRKQW